MVTKIVYKKIGGLVFSIAYEGVPHPNCPDLYTWKKIHGSERVVDDPVELKRATGKEA